RERAERPKNALDDASKGLKECDVVDMSRQQQLVRHVEDEQRLHAVIGEALAAFGEGEEAEAPGMAEEGDVAAVGRCELDLGVGIGGGHARSFLAAAGC